MNEEETIQVSSDALVGVLSMVESATLAREANADSINARVGAQMLRDPARQQRRCPHGKYLEKKNLLEKATLEDCWNCFDEAIKRGELLSKNPLCVAAREALYDPSAEGWIEVGIDEPRITPLAPCIAEVWSAEEFIAFSRTQRSRRDPLLAELDDVGSTVPELRHFLAGVREQYRRAARDSSEGIDRSALTVDIGDGSRVEFEILECFEDERVRHGRHDLHGHKDPRRKRKPEWNYDDEPVYVDEVAILPQVAALQTFVVDASEVEYLDHPATELVA
jgi:hypothetical protein